MRKSTKKSKPPRMSEKTKAICYGYRNPPPGQKKLSFNKIKDLVKLENGHNPTEGAVRLCVKTFGEVKNKRGRTDKPRTWVAQTDIRPPPSTDFFKRDHARYGRNFVVDNPTYDVWAISVGCCW